ncbi:MAG: DUF4435 domain-containing protein [Chloroflexi bacterium]|nr:DUF4435 domain-containing protein [Chloroflexota bacterium]
MANPSNLGKENVSELLLSLPVQKKGFSFLFVEGGDDSRFWKRFGFANCDVFAAGTQDRVIETLRIKGPFKKLRRRVAGIVDPDYELIDPTGKLLVEDLLYDDVPDLENMIVSRRTIASAVLRPGPFADQDDASKFAEDWLNAAMQLSMDYGYFRLVAKQNRKFRLVPNAIESSYGDYINLDCLRLNRQKTAELVVNHSCNVRVTVADLLAEVKAAEDRHGRNPLLVRGKDLLNFMLCICMPVFDKSSDDESVRIRLADWLRVVRDSDLLFRRLHGKYKCEDLKCTKLYGRIGNWESANKPFRILKPEV